MIIYGPNIVYKWSIYSLDMIVDTTQNMILYIVKIE